MLFRSSDYRNVHGLNTNFLRHFGFSNANLLVNDFRKYIGNYEVVKVFENCPNSVSYDFFHNIEDIRLHNWTTRVNQTYHILSNRLKKSNCHNYNLASCNLNIHSSYEPYLNFNRCRKLSDQVKLEHGFHSALYDTFELYLLYKHDFEM